MDEAREDHRTPEERELDAEIETLRGFSTLGFRVGDYSAWADGGMRWVYEDRIWVSGLEEVSDGEELATRLRAMEDAELAQALGLSEEAFAIELDAVGPDKLVRREAAGSLQPPWERLLFDRDREIFVALIADGIQVAPLRVDWEGPATPVMVIRPADWAPWKLRRIYGAIDRVASARRRQYRDCARCDRPVPPEHREELEGQILCLTCMESDGTAF